RPTSARRRARRRAPERTCRPCRSRSRPTSCRRARRSTARPRSPGSRPPPPPDPLLGVKLSSATASGSCVNGKPALTGSSHVLGLTVAGQELPVDQAVTQVVNAIGGGTLDPSQLTSQPLPAPLDQIPLATLQPLLDALPDL